jgi:hypothetical protein
LQYLILESEWNIILRLSTINLKLILLSTALFVPLTALAGTTTCSGHIDPNGNFTSNCNQGPYTIIPSNQPVYKQPDFTDVFTELLKEKIERKQTLQEANNSEENQIRKLSYIYDREMDSLIYPNKVTGFKFINKSEQEEFYKEVGAALSANAGTINSDDDFIYAIHYYAKQVYGEVKKRRNMKEKGSKIKLTEEAKSMLNGQSK